MQTSFSKIEYVNGDLANFVRRSCRRNRRNAKSHSSLLTYQIANPLLSFPKVLKNEIHRHYSLIK